MKPYILPDNILKCLPLKDRPKGNAGLTSTEAQAKQGLRLENEIQKEIHQWLSLKGIWCAWDGTHKKRTGTPGQPDFIFAIPGRSIGVEVKLPGKYPTPEQEACHRAMRANGWRVVVVYSLREVIEIVREESGEKPFDEPRSEG